MKPWWFYILIAMAWPVLASATMAPASLSVAPDAHARLVSLDHAYTAYDAAGNLTRDGQGRYYDYDEANPSTHDETAKALPHSLRKNTAQASCPLPVPACVPCCWSSRLRVAVSTRRSPSLAPSAPAPLFPATGSRSILPFVVRVGSGDSRVENMERRYGRPGMAQQ